MHLHCYKKKQRNNRTNALHTQLTAYTQCPDIEFNIDQLESYALSRLYGIVCLSAHSAIQKHILHNSIKIDRT